MQCLQEQGFPTFEYQSVEMNDEGVFTSTCKKGHTTFTNLQQQKFEILYEYGIMALLDGYPREAITSAAASLERFYEYFITIICLKNKIEIDKFNTIWKSVSNQSERQFGAYLFTYFIDKNGDIPPIIDNDKPVIANYSKNETKTWKEFRNNVVHKGYIPSSEEAYAYLELVYNHITILIKNMKENYDKEIQQSIFNHLLKKHPKGENPFVSTMSISTILNINEACNKTFKEAIDKAKISQQILDKNNLK